MENNGDTAGQAEQETEEQADSYSPAQLSDQIVSKADSDPKFESFFIAAETQTSQFTQTQWMIIRLDG